MKAPDKLPLWKDGIALSIMIFLISVLFVSSDAPHGIPNFIIGIGIAAVLFIVSVVFGATHAMSRRRAEMLEAKEKGDGSAA